MHNYLLLFPPFLKNPQYSWTSYQDCPVLIAQHFWNKNVIKHLKTVLNAWYWCAFGKKIRNHNSFFFEKFTVHSCIVPFDFMLFYFKHVFLFSIYNFGKKKNFKIIFRVTGNRSIEISFIFGTFRSKQKNDKVSQFFF